MKGKQKKKKKKKKIKKSKIDKEIEALEKEITLNSIQEDENEKSF